MENLNYDLVSLHPPPSRVMVQSEINLFKACSAFCTLFILIKSPGKMYV